ncbi:6768_t:CDS:2 [Funneliformis geosporum]|uniref:17615_t:CDS:1 n=1 Tax=Funneliformis geosporum TaxID=1117311 RepID=A0A9W4SQ54_9GLOM|nr:17615_t:CDS:2 [Funneliformis geosporum]CAI2177572.1 6768_t:CDS:2 [Funneliformis geosporum]
MDTDWCIMCDSHCNIPGAIYCSEECKLQDRLSACPSLASTTNSSISSVSTSLQYPTGGNTKFEKSPTVKFVTPKTPSIQFAKVQPPQQPPTLFYHRGPMPRYKHTSSKACASASNVRDRKITKAVYVQ